MRVVNAGKKVDVGNLSVVVRVIRSVDCFRAIFVGFVRVSFRFFGSLVLSFRAEDKQEKSDCRGGNSVILQNVE